MSGLQGDIEAAHGKSSEAKEEGGVISQRPVPSWQPGCQGRGWGCGVPGIPGLHTRCVMFPWGNPKVASSPATGTRPQAFRGT